MEGAVLTHVEVQDLATDLIMKMGTLSVCCWWKLLGDDHNRLCKLLDTPWSGFQLMLRKCCVLHGPADSFRTSEFENLMRRDGID